ncbi:WD40 repeat domain-containing protein [Streptacidiphilus sp. PAMC 29251]
MTADEVKALLEQMASAAATGTAAGTGTGDEWRQTWTQMTGGLLDDGTVVDGAYAALPHLVEAAAALPPEQSADFWVDLGFIVTAEDRPPVPAELQAGFSAALRLAEQAAAQSFLTAAVPANDCAYLALSCVAFAGHHTGAALWNLELQESYLQLLCPGCGNDTEIDPFFVDPVRPPFKAPELPDPGQARQEEQPWGSSWNEIATALREDALGAGWEPFLRVARTVAAAGIPPETPGPAVLCLVAGMVAAKGAPQGAGRELARKLMLLTGHFRCWGCEQTWTIADGLVEDPTGARPQEHLPQAGTAADRSATTATSAATRLPRQFHKLRQDGSALLAADGTPWGRISVFSDSAPGSFGGVNSLTVVTRPGHPLLVAGAGDRGAVCLWNAADGRLIHGPLLPGHPDRIRSMTSLLLPEGRSLLASGGDSGTIAVWDAVTGQPAREPVGDRPGGVIGMCAATVPDGRTLLVTATSRGAVRLWDPVTGEPVGRLNPYGAPIQSIAAVPIAPGHTLIAATDTPGRVHVWDPAVDDPWERGAAVQLSGRAVNDAGHRPGAMAAVAAVPTQDGAVLATGDNLGTVTLWDLATGAPISDDLPASTGSAGIPVMTGTTLHDGRSVLVVGVKHRHNLRVWEPATGTVQHIALDVAVSCLATAGSDLIVGHGHGVLGLPLTRE